MGRRVGRPGADGEGWRSQSRIEDIRSGLADLLQVVQELGLDSVAVPALGCGNGGLADGTFTDRGDVPGAPGRPGRAVPSRRSAGPDHHASGDEKAVADPHHAALLVALDRYLRRARAQEVREGVSELKIQKLVYFMQVLGERDLLPS